MPGAGREGIVQRVALHDRDEDTRGPHVLVRLEPHPEDRWGGLWAFQLDQVEAVQEAASPASPGSVMPPVVGKSLDGAKAVLTSEPFRLSIVQVSERFHDTAPSGEVIKQTPAPGETVSQGFQATLTVSKGVESVTVPAVEGKPIEEGVAELRELGLDVTITEQARPLVGPHRQGDFGRIEWQEPAGGAMVAKGQQVSLYTFSEEVERATDVGAPQRAVVG